MNSKPGQELKDTRNIYTVTELTQGIKKVLEEGFGYVWVEGEISNLRPPVSGHLYFTLKDQFCGLKVALFQNFRTKIKFDLEDGLNIICYGRVTVYEPRGEYQIRIEYIEPKGLGNLMLAFEQLKKKLAKEGLFDEARKKEIPFLPQRIGIVTSVSGAAIRDVIKVLKRRFPNLYIQIYSVRVQGEHAKEDIVQALGDFNAMKKKPDVIILGRGGGSIEDLWAFNEEIVARAIFASSIPVISAVGHERDWTISDMVSDLRAATPSVAAELVVREKGELEDSIFTLQKNMKRAIFVMLDNKKKLLDSLSGRYGLFKIKDLIPQKTQRLDDMSFRLNKSINDTARNRKEKLHYILKQLENLNPLSILHRGYSVTNDAKSGKIIKKAGEVKLNQLIKTKLYHGAILSRVEKITPN